ncbi:putative transferase CAF17, mitochondrial [Madurella mycetomatis]|uniref:Iron-sulfur cluster assembly factor IBA57 homolog, mitochondrial n=1 Tax=Madurella mycetomatis TaxID=100816 RepID=A0A175VUI5_9PEZI|nr:putative transferase CAF17, mitochondrial [Madurella mycetomatis]
MQPARRFLSFTGAFTCRGCVARHGLGAPGLRQQHRAFSRSGPRQAAPPGPSRSGLVSLNSRRLISVSGPDAAKYLQGVITANLLAGGPQQHLRTDSGFYAAFLTAQGRVLHDVFIYPDVRQDPANSFLLEVDASEAERLQRHIKRYKLRAKFDVRVLDEDEGRVWHAWNDGDDANAAFPTPSSANANIITVPDTRAPGLGRRIVTLGNSGSSPVPDLDLPRVAEEGYLIRRYLFGVPEGQSEILREQALPHESNIDLMGGVDFHKGCYVGQELTIRTEHRGVVRKRVLPCLIYPSSDGSKAPEKLEYQPAVGQNVRVTADMVPAEASIGRVGKKGRSAGKWLKGVGNLGLALCRLEIMTDVVLPGETGGAGFNAEDEFVVGLGTEGGNGEEQKVKIKAFVPGWLRERLSSREGSH